MDERIQRKPTFKIVVRKIERPLVSDPQAELEWICRSLGFFEAIDKDKTASTVFKEIVRANESGEALTSTAIARRVGMSRGSVINHLNNLIRSGLIIRSGRYYEPRSRSISRTIEEVEDDIEAIFSKMKKIARDIDEELGLPVPKDN